MSQQQKEAQREKSKLAMMQKRQVETEEQTATAREKSKVAMKRKRQAETEEQNATAREKSKVAMKRKRQAKTEVQTAMAREKNKTAMKRKHQAKTEENNDDMTNVINWSMQEAKKFLRRTQDPAHPHKHRAFVCIICDHFIIGTETIHKLKKEEMLMHSKRLRVESYKNYYDTTLKPKVTKQYQVNVDGLKGMLLSPRSRKYRNGYATCSVCYSGMQPQMANKKTPPKFAIANGFVIGRNNTDDSTNETVEANYEGGTYFFSLAQDPSENTLVYGSSDRFAIAMFKRSAPTLLAFGGMYTINVEMNVENILDWFPSCVVQYSTVLFYFYNTLYV